MGEGQGPIPRTDRFASPIDGRLLQTVFICCPNMVPRLAKSALAAKQRGERRTSLCRTRRQEGSDRLLSQQITTETRDRCGKNVAAPGGDATKAESCRQIGSKALLVLLLLVWSVLTAFPAAATCQGGAKVKCCAHRGTCCAPVAKPSPQAPSAVPPVPFEIIPGPVALAEVFRLVFTERCEILGTVPTRYTIPGTLAHPPRAPPFS